MKLNIDRYLDVFNKYLDFIDIRYLLTYLG